MSKPYTNPFFEADMYKMCDMSRMTDMCRDMSKMFDMSKMTDMSKMFDMSRMTDMSKMFDTSRYSDLFRSFDPSRFADMFKTQDMTRFFDAMRTGDMTRGADMFRAFDLSKTFSNINLPQYDAEAAFALQRKNIEAFTALSQTAYENMQSLMSRQMDNYRQMMQDLTQTMQTVMACPTTESKAIKQAEVSKATLDKYLANLRDASETIAKCNTQAMETVTNRLNEGMTELRGIVRNATDRADRAA